MPISPKRRDPKQHVPLALEAIYVGPGGPHVKNPGTSTTVHIYGGSGGPYATEPGRPTIVHIYVGLGAPYAKVPGEVNN